LQSQGTRRDFAGSSKRNVLTPDTPPRIAAGTKIDHYEIVSWLGAGGMGVVYRARYPRLGRDVRLENRLDEMKLEV
jgi:hypothetical protein